MFLDEAIVEFTSGRGGSGAVSFHREKFVPRGGPDGADGGRGGDVILIADRGKRTLYDFKLQNKFEAESGVHGVNNKHGRNGRDVIIKLPVGTIVSDYDTGEVIVDLNRHEMKFVLCKGGKGGQGNLHYANSVRQAPNFAQKGAPGAHLNAHLELKLLADVGIIGLPNAGKSTLISSISAARPKIADYPFTTIVPNLGVVRFRDTSFVVADMPGLIKGASEGIGLGHQFLKHVERNRVLVHLVECNPIDESDPLANFELIENELKLYSDEIFARPRIVAISKTDLGNEKDIKALQKKLEKFGFPVYAISAATHKGIDDLLQVLANLLDSLPVIETTVLQPALGRLADDRWEVVADGDGCFHVNGERIVRMFQMTDMENTDALRYLHRRLSRIGVIEKLREMGVEEGDTVIVGEDEFAFTDM